MSNFHPKVSDNDVAVFLQTEAWERAGVKVKKLEEEAQVEEEVEVIEEATEDKVEEAKVETHSCPLCESELKEPISEETLKEHINMIVDLINESTDELEGEEVIEEEVVEESDD